MVSPGISGVKPSESATYISTILTSPVDFSPQPLSRITLLYNMARQAERNLIAVLHIKK
jgi:hypothetical protein